MEDFVLAAVSMRSRPAEPAANRAAHEPWVRQARDRGASVCLFPEMSVSGFCYDTQAAFAAGEPVGGESTAYMVELAQRYGLVLGFGLAARNDRDLLTNAYVFVSPEGCLGHYAKTHIPIAEYAVETPGSAFTVVDVGPARLGVNICFDNWFSEAGRLSYLAGAEVIVAPFYMGGPCEKWTRLATINFPSVAWQNGVYHVTINACGPVDEKGMRYDGPPILLVYNPLGELECEGDAASGEEQMVVHTLRAATLQQRRGESHFHPKYRRPSLYGRLLDPLNP